jgi:L-aspartate oxidase
VPNFESYSTVETNAMKTDFLVIGSGIAGLTYALKVAQHCPDRQVMIITKASPDETNTKYAQGGIAVVNDLEKDSFEKHIEDTLIAGDGLCDPEVVEIVVKEGPARVQEIINWGAQFDKDAEGDFKLGKEGGHSEFRILHHKDVTGREMERALLEAVRRAPNITVVHHCFVIDIITQQPRLPGHQVKPRYLLLRRVCAECPKQPD